MLTKPRKMPPTLRIYLTKGMRLTTIGDNGHERVVEFPRAGFYNAGDDVAAKWIEEGIAFAATDDNKVIGYDGNGKLEIDIGAGESLEGVYATIGLIPQAELENPEPEPEVEGVLDGDEDESSGSDYPDPDEEAE